MTSRRRAAVHGRRRRQRVAAAGNDLTTGEWEALQQAWDCCAYCGTGVGPWQKDCVLPISRGGRYTVSNVVPACRSCNASKCHAEVTSWMRRKRLDEAAFLRRHLEVLATPRPELNSPGSRQP